MRILNIIDSLELNGGSTMFLEMTAAMIKYWTDDDIVPFVVSKSGQYGRKNLIDSSFSKSYGVQNLMVCDYQMFETMIAQKERNAVIFHHVLGHTKPLRFHRSCRYIVINHTMTNIKRLSKFNPLYRLVSVCKYFGEQARKRSNLNSKVILNGIEDYYQRKDRDTDTPFVIGRCQRIVPSKYSKVVFDESIFLAGYKQIIIGPVNSGKESRSARVNNLFLKQDVLVGTVFERGKKIELIRDFDVYLHYTHAPEGASMAILEALSCGVPVLANTIGGGVNDLIKNGVNGYFFKGHKHLNNILLSLQDVKTMRVLGSQ